LNPWEGKYGWRARWEKEHTLKFIFPSPLKQGGQK